MNEVFEFEAGQEPERYELDADPRYCFVPDRREFLKFVGGGILVLLATRDTYAQQEGRGRRFGGREGAQEIGAWLHIAETGEITVFTGKVEIGQNIRSSLTQVVAEELHAPPQSIRLVMADTQLVPFDAGTFGSRTTPDMAQRLRTAAATARETLIDLAAEKWKIDRTRISAAEGKIVNGDSKESLEFGQLTQGQKLTKTVSAEARKSPPDEWTVAGRELPKVNGRDFVTGGHKYASDMSLPEMLHGKVLRPKSLGGKLKAAETTAAEQMDGVVVVRDGEFVGVAAPTEFAAGKAVASIKAEWSGGSQGSHEQLFEQLKKSTGRQQSGRGGGNTQGSMTEGLKEADVRVDQTYTIAYIAHAPLEPRTALANWEDGKLTVWTGTQRPFGVRGELANAFGLSENDVHVIVPDMGSGYGGKHSGEAAIEAARIAKGAGRPVKLVWTREEEFTWAYFRPAGVIDVTGGARRDGTLTAWEFHNYNSGASAIRTLYRVPNQVIAFHGSQSPLKQGSYRALASTANVFARETHMDELAHALKMDPLEFRLKNLDDSRLRDVLEAAARAFGWGAKPESGHGCGIAGGSEKGSYIATCAEVRVDSATGAVQVVRAVSAFECGTIVSPDHLKNQVEGAMVMGLGGALWEAIEFRDGQILNPRFSEYRVPRFRDTPLIEVVLLDRKDLASAGAGETPIIGIAPAIGNAIFSATGVRLRSMPLAPKMA